MMNKEREGARKQQTLTNRIRTIRTRHVKMNCSEIRSIEHLE